MSNTEPMPDLYFMTRWFPKRRRARATALFMLAIPLSSFIGAYAIGWIKGSTGSFEPGLLFLAALCALSGLLTLLQGHPADV
jgi:hypothetical protein